MQSGICKGVVIVASAWCLAPFSFAANHLQNPGFENGLNSWSDLWGVPGTVSTQKHSGVYSAEKHVGFVTTDYWSQVYQDIALTNGQRVYARIWAKSTFNPEGTARSGILLQFLNANNSVIGQSNSTATVGGTQNWRLLEAVGRAPNGTRKVRMNAYLWAAKGDTLSLNKGNVFFDDASLDKTNRTLALPASLSNAGFENGLNDWTDLYGAPSTLAKTNQYAGKYAARKRVDTVASQDFWSQVYQDVACSGGKRVTARIWARPQMKAAASARGGLMVHFFTVAGALISEYTSGTVVGGTAGWTQLSVVVNAPAGTARVRINGYLWAPKGDANSVGAQVLFDNASLSVTTP